VGRIASDRIAPWTATLNRCEIDRRDERRGLVHELVRLGHRDDLPPEGDDVEEDGEVLHVLNYDNTELLKIKPGETVMSRGRMYPDEFRIGGFSIGDFSGTGKMEIVVLMNHLHSPSIVSRYDAGGNRLGTYRHFGQLTLMGTKPIANGARRELVLYGGSDREEGDYAAVILGLDPSLITGDGESSFSGGFGLANHLDRLVEQLAFGKVFENEALQFTGAGSQDNTVRLPVVRQDGWIIGKLLAEPIEVKERQFQLRFDLRHTRQQMARKHRPRDQVGLVGGVVTVVRDEVEEVILFELEEVGRKFPLFAVLVGHRQFVSFIFSLLESPDFRLLRLALFPPGAGQPGIKDDVFIGVERVERGDTGWQA